MIIYYSLSAFNKLTSILSLEEERLSRASFNLFLKNPAIFPD